MKTRTQQLKDFLKGMAFGFFVVSVMFLVVGCSKDKSGGNDRNNRYNDYWRDPRYGGPGYGGGNVSHVAMGIDNMSGSSLIAAVSTDPGGMSGEAFVEGELDLRQDIPCGYEGVIRGGRYVLYPLDGQPGYFSNGMLSNIQLEARGPGGIIFVNIPYGSIFTSNVCGFLGLSASVEIYVPGYYNQFQYCGSMFVSDQVGGACY